MSGPTVVDLFCGGGGFSEGFRRAGFDVVYAVDKSSGACNTHELNHPDSETVEADIIDIEPENLPSEVDVLIGSPPCTEFSMAKQGGGGDIDDGMRLVGHFLRFVVELEPDYWVMENVPRLEEYLPRTVGYDQIPPLDSDDGELEIPVMEILDASEYNTPQRRNRLFSGDFPLPQEGDTDTLTLGKVQDHFPNPVGEVRADVEISDPLYDVTLPASDLVDHFYNSFLSKRDAKEIEVRKVDHSFYGKMSFPDDPHEPARTVLATNRRVSRETLVLEEDESYDGLTPYRKPTIREIATIQGFPITYQFTGDCIPQKWRRVGDAVPPTLSYAISKSIRADMGLEQVVIERREQSPPWTNLNDLSFDQERGRKLSFARQFRHHVPMDDMRDFRVDIETEKDVSPAHPLDDVVGEKLTHPVSFRTHFYRGYAEEVEDIVVNLESTLEVLEQISRDRYRLAVADFLRDLDDRMRENVPDATTVQAVRSRRYENGGLSETVDYDLLQDIADTVDEHFDFFGAREWHMSCPDLFPGDQPGDEDAMIPGRVLMKLIAANYVCWKLDHGARWLVANPDRWYIRDEWSLGSDRSSLVRELSSRPLPDERLESLLASRIDGIEDEAKVEE